MGIRPIPSFAFLSLSLSLCVSSSKLIPPSFIVTRNVHVFLSRRKRRVEVGGKRGVRKSVSVGVCSNALATRSRLSKRTESHSREHLWSLPASLLFFFTLLRLPSSLSRSLSLSLATIPVASVLLLTCSVTYGSSADRSGSTVALKGLAQFSSRGSTRLEGPSHAKWAK